MAFDTCKEQVHAHAEQCERCGGKVQVIASLEDGGGQAGAYPKGRNCLTQAVRLRSVVIIVPRSYR